MSVRVREFEAAQSIACILQWRAEGHAVPKKFGGKRIRVGRINIGVPPHRWMTLGIRQRRNFSIGLDEQLRSIAAENGEEGIPLRLLKRGFKSQLLAIERDGSLDVADDEER